VRKKLLLFDLDWTLVSTGGAGVRAYDQGFEHLFKVPQALDKVPVDGKTDRAIARELIRVYFDREATEEEINATCAAYIERLTHEVATSAAFKILPGIAELLPILAERSDVLLALGTGNLKAGAAIKLARPQLGHYFSFGGFADDSEHRPTVLRAGVTRGEALVGKPFSPRDVVVIGDNWRDVDAGKAIGATTVAVATGPMNTAELAAHHPDYVFDDLSDTEKVLHVLTV
jgi:phosphoglycolate phosphatase